MTDPTREISGNTPARVLRDESLVGTTLDGRYRIERRLAEGGMGVVYEATQEALGRRVAVKVLHAHLADDAEMEARFRREALAITAVQHPNVVEVYDLAALPDGRHYLVLELLRGRELAKLLLERGPLPVGLTARVLAQVAAGVHAAHERGIVHRDLKPENVFLVDETPLAERVKVVDFGVARFLDANAVDSKTRTGTTVGTPYYMAPEQAQGRRDIDGRTDVYALGVVAFRMLTGHHPFDDESYPMLVVKICTEPPPSLATWRRDVPLELVRLVDRMLSKLPASRPASMREVQALLEPFASLERAVDLTGAPPPERTLPTVLDGSSTDASTLGRSDPLAATARATTAELEASTRRSPTAKASERTSGDDARDDDELDPESVALVAPRPRGALPYVAGTLGLASLGLFAWMTWGEHDAPVAPREPSSVALPEPRPPLVRALPPAELGAGWSFVNPRPRVMPSWNAVANAGPDLVALVGAQGTAARQLHGALVTWRTGVDVSLFGVAWTSADRVLAAGEDGTLLTLDFVGPHRLDSGTHATLRAVASLSSTEQLVVGDAGTLLRVVGDRVVPVDIPFASDARPPLFAIAARGAHALAVGAEGTLVRIDEGRATIEPAPTSQTLRAVGGCPDAIYVAGDDGALFRRDASADSIGTGAWQRVRLTPEARTTFMALGCDHGRAIAVGAGGDVRLVSGLRSVQLASEFDGVFTGVAGAADEATWLVGSSGRIAVVASDHLESRVSGPIASLRDVGELGNGLVAVGDWGKVIREGRDALTLDQAPTDSGLGAVARVAPGVLVAVGDEGAIVRIRYDGMDLPTSPTHVGLRGVVGGEGQVLAVGLEGTIVRGTPDALVATALSDQPNLQGLTGTPTDALAVGEHGRIYALEESGTRPIPCDLDLSLRAVLRPTSSASPSSASTSSASSSSASSWTAWAVGEGGAVVRITAAGCALEHVPTPGAPNLNGLGVGPDGHLLAVGDLGTAYRRAVRHDAPGGAGEASWEPLDFDVGIVSLRAVRLVDRWVYVVGAGGVVLRHVRVDGA